MLDFKKPSKSILLISKRIRFTKFCKFSKSTYSQSVCIERNQSQILPRNYPTKTIKITRFLIFFCQPCNRICSFFNSRIRIFSAHSGTHPTRAYRINFPSWQFFTEHLGIFIHRQFCNSIGRKWNRRMVLRCDSSCTRSYINNFWIFTF